MRNKLSAASKALYKQIKLFEAFQLFSYNVGRKNGNLTIAPTAKNSEAALFLGVIQEGQALGRQKAKVVCDPRAIFPLSTFREKSWTVEPEWSSIQTTF